MNPNIGEIYYLDHSQPHFLIIGELQDQWITILIQSPSQNFLKSRSYLLTDYLQWEILYQIQLVDKNQLQTSWATKVDQVPLELLKSLLSDMPTRQAAVNYLNAKGIYR